MRVPTRTEGDVREAPGQVLPYNRPAQGNLSAPGQTLYRVGQQVAGFGADYGQIAARHKAEKQIVLRQEANSSFADQESIFLYGDPEGPDQAVGDQSESSMGLGAGPTGASGSKKTAGLLARKGKDAAGLTTEYLKWADETVASLTRDMDPRAAAAFRAEIQDMIARRVNELSHFEAGEMHAVRLSAALSQETTLIARAAADYDDPELVEQHLQKTLATIDSVKGLMTPEGYSERRQMAIDEIFSRVIRHLIQDDPQQGAERLKAVRPRMSDLRASELDKYSQTAEENRLAQKTVLELRAMGKTIDQTVTELRASTSDAGNEDTPITVQNTTNIDNRTTTNNQGETGKSAVVQRTERTNRLALEIAIDLQIKQDENHASLLDGLSSFFLSLLWKRNPKRIILTLAADKLADFLIGLEPDQQDRLRGDFQGLQGNLSDLYDQLGQTTRELVSLRSAMTTGGLARTGQQRTLDQLVMEGRLTSLYMENPIVFSGVDLEKFAPLISPDAYQDFMEKRSAIRSNSFAAPDWLDETIYNLAPIVKDKMNSAIDSFMASKIESQTGLEFRLKDEIVSALIRRGVQDFRKMHKRNPSADEVQEIGLTLANQRFGNPSFFEKPKSLNKVNPANFGLDNVKDLSSIHMHLRQYLRGRPLDKKIAVLYTDILFEGDYTAEQIGRAFGRAKGTNFDALEAKVRENLLQIRKQHEDRIREAQSNLLRDRE